ncbi:AEC family transporter [Kiritimatiella glycovorans]|uniref:Putative permease n=1 Tax=Kiritimatiella glycovorans TaxID=1307763 RepID=A0A0G3EIW7_9BACT|nr:AEC family transporter [Kiritimatiella glycovorans]AKJ64114.1 putative permease [Kiritimatiella glycovorans]
MPDTFMLLVFNVLCILAMMLPGVIARRRGWLTAEGTRQLANLLINVVFPCLIFTSIYSKYTLRTLARDWEVPLLGAAIMLTGFAVGRAALTAFRNEESGRRRAFLFQCTVNNFVFLPLPIVLFLYGDRGVAVLVFSSLGAKLVLWTLGAGTLQGQTLRSADFRGLLNPALIAIPVAIAVRALTDAAGWSGALLDPEGRNLGAFLFRTTRTVGEATIPLAMIVAGSRVGSQRIRQFRDPMLWTMSAVRLVAVPALALGLLYALPLPPMVERVMSIVAVMPVAISGIALAEVYGGDRAFMSAGVLLTHALALVIVPLWLAAFL